MEPWIYILPSQSKATFVGTLPGSSMGIAILLIGLIPSDIGEVTLPLLRSSVYDKMPEVPSPVVLKLKNAVEGLAGVGGSLAMQSPSSRAPSWQGQRVVPFRVVLFDTMTRENSDDWFW